MKSTNFIIKKEHIIGGHLPVSHFIKKLSDLIIKWPMDSNPKLQERIGQRLE